MREVETSRILRVRQVKGSTPNKYLPHSGNAERKRRLKQIAAGSLHGDYVTVAARYKAAGLVDPTEIYLLKEQK